MSKMRYVNTDFWTDIWVVDHLNPLDRYLFIYLFTNPHTNVAGVYELSIRIMGFETGIEKDELSRMLLRLQPKVKYVDGWVILRNGIKNQNYKNEKMKRGIEIVLERVPSEVLQHISWPKDFGNPRPEGSKQTKLLDDSSIGHVYPAGNSNNNSDSNPVVPTVAKTKSVDKSTIETTGLSKKGFGKQYLDVTAVYDDLSAQGLVNPKFKAWYCSIFFKIGREKVMILASQARVDGQDPIKLFSHLLQKEVKKRNNHAEKST